MVMPKNKKPKGSQAKPKRAAKASSAAIHKRGEIISGHEPMTGAQASDLKTLAEEVHELQAYEVGLSRNEASKRINWLKEKRRLDELPPHTD